MSLVATSLSLRLVLEQNLFGYYFMALAAALVLLDASAGHIRGQLVAWIGLVALAFDPVPWEIQVRQYLPPLLMLLVLASSCATPLKATSGGIWWRGLRSSSARLCASFPITSLPFRHLLPTWLWQVILVPIGFWLAFEPLFSFKKDDGTSEQSASLHKV